MIVIRLLLSSFLLPTTAEVKRRTIVLAYVTAPAQHYTGSEACAHAFLMKRKRKGNLS